MPLNKDMTHEEIVQELMNHWKETGLMGGVRIESKEEALERANAIAYRVKEGK